MHPTHVGVAHRTGEQQLLTQRLVVARHARFFTHDLERAGLLGAAVVGEKHLAHATLTQTLPDLVTIVDDGSVP